MTQIDPREEHTNRYCPSIGGYLLSALHVVEKTLTRPEACKTKDLYIGMPSPDLEPRN
jgi:hypothetical protein